MLRNIAVVVSAIEVIIDVLAIGILLLMGMDPGLRQFLLTWALALTLVGDIAVMIYLFFGAPGITMTVRAIRGAIHGATWAIALTLVALFLILVPVGLSYWWLFAILMVLLVVTLIQDIEVSRRVIG